MAVSAAPERRRFHRFLRLSYPNAADRARAQRLGVKPGSAILIHGLPNGQGSVGKDHVKSDWTWGRIAVTDDGKGIAPEIAAHLFEPLRSSKPVGVGLGLVTARAFVEAHGGRIASVPVERGARFEIRLPRER